MIRVRASDGRTVASREGSFGKFADRSTRRLTLTVIDANATIDDVRGGDGCVEWLNQGSNDQWNASFDFVVRFTGGASLVGSEPKTEFQEGKAVSACARLR